jgi:DNA replication protein DnaC
MNYLKEEIIKQTPPRYKKASYDDVPKNIKDKFEKIGETMKGLYIHGSVGTGKTHIAYALYKEAPEKIKDFPKELKLKIPMFLNVSELLREIKLDYGRDDKDKKFIEEEVMDFKGILFLDDIGSEKITDWVEEMFYLIINKRYNEMLPIIFTSNLSIQELADKVGDRIASRVVELCDVEKLQGNDKRLK